MPRLAANISMLYPELPFLDRFEAAARDGFAAVECLFPYAYPVAEMYARLRGNGLQLVLFNAPAAGADGAEAEAGWNSGERGTAAQPGREAEFHKGVELALRYATALECPRIHCMAGRIGIASGAEGRAAARAAYVQNLEWAARRVQPAGCDILIEPLNHRDNPHYFLSRQDDAHEIVQQVGQANLKIQMDLYHCQVVEGDAASKIRRWLPTGRIGHFQIAGVPERHEPDEGELDYRYLLGVIDEVSAACGWQGWVGCEYRPRGGMRPGGTSAGLAWRTSLD